MLIFLLCIIAAGVVVATRTLGRIEAGSKQQPVTEDEYCEPVGPSAPTPWQIRNREKFAQAREALASQHNRGGEKSDWS